MTEETAVNPFDNAKSNLMHGEIHVDLDHDADTNQIMCAYIDAGESGIDAPSIAFVIRHASAEVGECEALWRVDVAMLRKLCDMADAMHGAAEINWRRTGA